MEEDGHLAVHLSAELRVLGYETWTYQENGVPARSYLEQTYEAIQRCDAFVLLASPMSVRSHEVRTEVERAHRSRKTIVPVRIAMTPLEFEESDPVIVMACGTAVSLLADASNLHQVAQGIQQGLGATKPRAMTPQPHVDSDRAADAVAGTARATSTLRPPPAVSLGSGSLDATPSPDHSLTSHQISALRRQLEVLADLNAQVVQDRSKTIDVAERFRQWKKDVSDITGSDFIYDVQPEPGRQGPYATLRNTIKQCRRAIEERLLNLR